MSDDAMSQSQVEGLLRAMEQGIKPGGKTKAPAASPSEGAGTPNKPEVAARTERPIAVNSLRRPARERVVLYDFKRPERVGKEQMRALHSLHESIARKFAANISGMLRTIVEVKLLSVDQMTYSEFVFSLDNPSCFNVLKPSPLDGHWILDISPSLSYAVITRMLGGDPSLSNAIQRPLTEIENRLVGRLVRSFLDELTELWSNVVELELDVERVESNPQLVQIVPPNEVAIQISLEVTIGESCGNINLCIPFNTIERFNTQLSNNGWVGYGKGTTTDQTRQAITTRMDIAQVELVVTLARSKIRTRDLVDLNIGDVITTEQEVSAPLELSVQGVPKFHAKAGAYRGKKAIRIEGLIDG